MKESERTAWFLAVIVLALLNAVTIIYTNELKAENIKLEKNIELLINATTK